MESLQEMMSAVMARQAIEDTLDTSSRDIQRVANRLAYEQDPGTDDPFLVKAAEMYLRFQTEETVESPEDLA